MFGWLLDWAQLARAEHFNFNLRRHKKLSCAKVSQTPDSNFLLGNHFTK
jgi:hypothetical protein